MANLGSGSPARLRYPITDRLLC
uniref:Uncharacterized protein n=1 Tax=Arundo donax TaxID=35708 RepID=A0A0A9F949_ARUDO